MFHSAELENCFKRPEANLLSFFHILSVLSVYVKLFFRDLESLSESSPKMRLVPFLNGNVINLLSLDYVTTYEKFSTFPQLFHLFLWREKLGFSELSNPLQRHDDIVAFMGFQTIECIVVANKDEKWCSYFFQTLVGECTRWWTFTSGTWLWPMLS